VLPSEGKKVIVMWHGYYYGGGWPMILGSVLFWGAIIALIAWAIHRLTGRRDDGAYLGISPLDHLKERYARGEITKEEYEQIKRDLLG